MAVLTSPGVSVTITDESQYLPAPTNSVPLVVVATAQNKADATGAAVAPATTAANAGKLYQVTSQRDLVNLYGTPFFYTTTNGTPIQGYELNEYGLLAAYSSLGVTNRCYVIRADIDLASLVGQTSRPTAAPANGTYWLDTTTSTWGIYEFNASTGQFELQIPIVISDATSISGGAPLDSIGNIGQYAVNAIMPDSTNPYANSQYFYKNLSNQWVTVGSIEWLESVPAVQGTNSNPELTAGDTFTIAITGTTGSATITVPNAPNDTAVGVAGVINSFNWAYLSASVDSSGKLSIYLSQPQFTSSVSMTLTNVSGTAIEDLGLSTVSPATFYAPTVVFGTASQMPLWSSSQSQPRPTGSVWFKVGASGNGLDPNVSIYNSVSGNWNTRNVTLATSDWSAINTLDSTGGKAIPAGTIYAQYAYDSTGSNPYIAYNQAPVFLWERTATGATVATGTETNWTLADIPDGGSAPLYALVSIPGSTTLSEVYEIGPLSDGDEPLDFVTAWQSASIPYTTCSVTTDGAIQLTHTEGGIIILSDWFGEDSPYDGTDSTILEQIGFVPDVTPNVKYSLSSSHTFSATGTGGTGSNFAVNVQQLYGLYRLVGNGVSVAGTGYTVGDTITIPYASLGGTGSANNLVVRVVSITGGGGTGPVGSVTVVSGVSVPEYAITISNWVPLDFIANEGAPVASPTNNTNWFYSVVDQVDIMVNYDGQWNGYRNLNYDSSGFPSASGSNTTDPNGPIVTASEPTTQSDGTALAYGDIWIDTSDLENYPLINRWQAVSGIAQWVRLDNTDQTSSSGVTFLDARWGSNGSINPVDDPIPTVKSLLTSDYVDLDAPNTSTYPAGMLLFNTRRSGYNVKQFKTNYFTNANFPDAGAYDAGDTTNIDNLPLFSYTWVTASGNKLDGSPYMGRQAQRIMVVEAMKSVVDTNADIRDEDNFFNLMAAPYYPELQANMVALNNERGQTGYIIGDTPMRLPNNATDIQAYATSQPANGGPVRDTYLGLFYPSGLTNDLSGNEVAVPPSHMMLRTFLRNDTVSYPWLAAAGTRRGTIDNATGIGYLDATTGEFVKTKTNIGIRDVLYVNFINPLVFFTGVGLLNYGNKTSFNSQSSLDRTNVARLVAYLRRQLTLAARPFVFEPNDALTRNQISGVVQTLLVDLVAKRGIYDYLVVCDESNNTPARIDRNELWIDVAIEPVKAAEFIYIPVRVLNTGEIAGL